MSSKSYLDKVLYVSQEGKRINNFIVQEDLILTCRNSVKELLQKLDKREKACPLCNQVDQALFELDKQLFQLTQQPKLSYHEAGEVKNDK